MKKSLIVVSLVFALVLVSSSLAMAAGNVKLGYDFSGEVKGSANIDSEIETDTGMTLGFEYIFAEEQLEYGFGVEYQFERKVKDFERKFNFIPVYGVLNYQFPVDGDVKPYVTARLGYNFLTANDAFKNGRDTIGGLYYGAGIGVNIRQFIIEALYSENKGSLDGGADITNHQISLNVGYKF